MEWLTGRDLYRAVITEGVLRAERSIWIATANLKDLYVPGTGRRYRPILDEFSRLARDGVQIRVVACHEHGTGVAGFLPGSWDHLDCQSWDHPACRAGGSWVGSLDRRVVVAVMEVYGRGIQGGQCG